MLMLLILTLTTFATTSIILTLYFSAVIMDYASRAIIHIDAFKITFPGTIVSSISIFLNPMLPRLFHIGPFSSSLDIGISIAGILWIVLTRRYCKTSLLSTIATTAVAIIIYTFIMLFIGFFLLLLGGSPLWF